MREHFDAKRVKFTQPQKNYSSSNPTTGEIQLSGELNAGDIWLIRRPAVRKSIYRRPRNNLIHSRWRQNR
jgi:hypothetical protein